MANYEKEWTKKVECADEAHTRLYKLDVNEADRIMRNLEKFAAGGTPPACPEQRKQVWTFSVVVALSLCACVRVACAGI